MLMWLPLLLGSIAALPAPVVILTADSLVADPARLERLSSELPFARAVFGTDVADLAALHAQSAAYRSLVQVVAADVAQARSADPKAGVGMRYNHRLFDVGWLQSATAQLQLVAVALRLDRAPFAPEHCGELRLIYRLTYRTQVKGHTVASRLPLTVNAVRWLDGDCAALAKNRRSDGTPQVLDNWAKLPVKAIELNLQTLRWPSTVRADLGGHAEYAMHVLQPVGAQLQRVAMENQLDVAAIAKDSTKLAKLRQWLRLPHTATQIDAGLALAPQELWATTALSMAPRSLMRLANRPFAQLLNDADVLALGTGDPVLGATRLRRLDQHSCTGCHQSRGIAGFHLPGSGATAAGWQSGRLAVAASAHLLTDLPRRQAYLQALATGAKPREQRPPPEVPRLPSQAGHGEHCGLRLENNWKCAAGLQCAQVDDRDVGVCLPAQRAIGDPCEAGVVQAGKTVGLETVPKSSQLSCGAGYCETSRIGFPAGLCAAGCGVTAGPLAPCAGIPGIVDFNACLARGTPFDQCAAAALRPARLRRCGLDEPCRDDYACMAASATVAVCMPPYFLQELRVDGHPLARK